MNRKKKKCRNKCGLWTIHASIPPTTHPESQEQKQRKRQKETNARIEEHDKIRKRREEKRWMTFRRKRLVL